MTTVAWDGNTLAADRQNTAGNAKCWIHKLRPAGDYMFAGAGARDLIDITLEWVASGADAKDRPTFTEAVSESWAVFLKKYRKH